MYTSNKINDQVHVSVHVSNISTFQGRNDGRCRKVDDVAVAVAVAVAAAVDADRDVRVR